MKKTVGLLLFIGMMGSIFAQEGDKRKERKEMIQKKRMEFVNERAELSADEAAKFWPLQEEMDAKKKALRGDAPKKKELDPESMTDAQAAEHLKEQLNRKSESLRIEGEYQERMIQAIGAKKLMAVIKADREFKKEVLKKLRDTDREFRPRGGERH